MSDKITMTYGDLMDEVAVEEPITYKSRWAYHRRKVFQRDGVFYAGMLECPATESQESPPWDSEVECVRVVPVTKTVTVYEEPPK